MGFASESRLLFGWKEPPLSEAHGCIETKAETVEAATSLNIWRLS